MQSFVRIVAGALLLVHGLVHLLYLADDVPEFSLDNSWMISESGARPLALGLMGATVAAFALLALGVWRVPGLAAAWPALAIAASLLSLALLILFWSWTLVFGVLIDIALIVVALARPGWAD
jgi:hypothetical protein